jgi:hypothetical protein
VLCRNSETDPDYNQPVSVVADADGFVAANLTVDADGALIFDIPTSTGTIRMFPYAQVDGWNGAVIQTWLPEN